MKGGGGDAFPPLSFVGPGKDDLPDKGNNNVAGARDGLTVGGHRHLFGSLSNSEALYENVPRRRYRDDDEEATYDVPRLPRRLPPLPPGGLLPRAARLVLMGVGAAADNGVGVQDEPDIPSPDYGSDGGSEESFEEEDELVDREGLDDEGHYYTEDQGLEVILEESEEEKGIGEEDGEASSVDDSASPDMCGTHAQNFGKRNNQTTEVVEVQSLTDSPLYEWNRTFEEQSRKGDLLNKKLFSIGMGRDTSKVDDNREQAGHSPQRPLPSVQDLRYRFESSPNAPRIASPTSPVHTRITERVSNGRRKPTLDSPPLLSVTALMNKVANNEEKANVTSKVAMLNIEDASDEYVACLRANTLKWNPGSLMDKLYNINQAIQSNTSTPKYTNISGILEKLPSGRKKATFWNAWKSRFFKAENGYLYCYQRATSEAPSMTIQLMGGKIEVLKPIGMDENQMKNCTLLGIDDGKGHYLVVKCPNEADASAWHAALLTQVVENFESTYVQPVNIIDNPSIMKDTLIIDLGSCSLRAGILSSQPSLPQIFFPSVMAVHKETNEKRYGLDAVLPDVRSESRIFFPIRPSAKITKYSVDLEAFYGLIEKVFKMLAVQSQGYNIFLSVPRSFNAQTLSNITTTMFEKWKIKSLSISHQSVLSLYAYNARSGIVVDIGERTDVIPISEGYILERGVTRTPYGSHQVVEKLRQLLLEKNLSFATDVESYLIRYIMENVCYCAQDYSTELKEALDDLSNIKKELSIKDVYCDSNISEEIISLDVGRFQAPEGLFTPETWGHDNIGVHKMIHKGIQECSLDIRKEMIRNIYLSGGVTMIPGFANRLLKEVDKLTPPTITPKVHASPYRYHAAYIGATVLANSTQVAEITVKRQEWISLGVNVLNKWNM